MATYVQISNPWNFGRLLRVNERAKREKHGDRVRTVIFLFMFFPALSTLDSSLAPRVT
jgi:hypothetical protein